MPGTRPEPAVHRARWSVTAYFLVAGMTLATWTARIPTVKQQLALDDAQVSLALLAVGGGSVLAMQVAGHLVDRFGSARVVAPAAVAVSLSLVLPALANGLTSLVAALLLFGIGHGLTDVSMNTHAMRVQRAYGRPIMSTFHALFSVGGLVGAGLGALAARVGLGVTANFALMGAALALVALIARFALLPDEPSRVRPAATASGGRGVPAAIVFLGVLGFFCSVGEGSVADWSPLYLHDVLGTSTAVAPIGYAVFSATMAVFRFLGDGLVLRFGPVVLVRCCGAVAGAGLGGALLLHHPVAAMAGFALFGVGLSCIVPQVFNAAGNRDPERSGRDLAQVSTLSYGGLLAGPVLIGLVADEFGLSVGLGIPALLALFIAASAAAVRRPAPVENCDERVS